MISKIMIFVGGGLNNLRKNTNIGPSVQGTANNNWPF